MKHLLFYILLPVAILTNCTGCKKTAILDQDKPVPACLIATQITKERLRPNQAAWEPETVTIEGETFQVTTTQKSCYSYDSQGRIVLKYNQYPDGKVDSSAYRYKPGLVLIRTTTIVPPSTDLTVLPRTVLNFETPLNEQELATKWLEGSEVTYDKDGYLVTLKDVLGKPMKVINGNILEWWSNLEGPSANKFIYKYQYDLTKPALPTVQTYLGKSPRNLLVGYTVDEDYINGIYPNVYTAVFTYVFDKQSRVKRQIMRAKNGEHSYIYGGLLFQLNDFTYPCP